MRTSGKQTSASNGRLKITLPNLTYPKAWAGSVPLCPVIFSWFELVPSVFSTPQEVRNKNEKL